MQQILSYWNGLPRARQLVAVLTAIAILVAVFTLSKMTTKTSLSLLYSGLEPDASGEVITALQAQGTVYEVRGNAIYVPADQRDQLRMTLAASGLPKAGVQGYEILDSLSGFGTTSQMFDAAYWRAKEGELARTIQSSPHITSARVHIAKSSSSAFRLSTQAKASVTISAVSGALSPRHAQALRFLISSAVPGMTPEDVAVIDDEAGLIEQGSLGAGAQAMTKPEDIKARVERLLEARVGLGNVVVEVSVETNTDTESISERIIDPQSRVEISSDTQETSNTSTGTQSGVTIASNLPDGDGASTGQNNAENSQTRQRINYEISETRREIMRQSGAIKRLSVAVLVNETSVQSGQDQTVPRSEEELQALRDLVASAVGFNEARGDVITLRTMAFQAAEDQGSLAREVPGGGFLSDPLTFIQTIVLAIVILVLGLFVVRPILLPRKVPQLPQLPGMTAALGAGDAALIAADGTQDSLIQDAAMLAQSGDDDPIQIGANDKDGGAIDSDNSETSDENNGEQAQTGDGDTSFHKLKDLISNKEDASLEILRTWIEERRKEERA